MGRSPVSFTEPSRAPPLPMPLYYRTVVLITTEMEAEMTPYLQGKGLVFIVYEMENTGLNAAGS